MKERDVNYVSSLYGGFWGSETKDFCYMTNPYFPPDEFIESLHSRLTELVKSYPSTNWYVSSLAAEPLGLTYEQLVIANGASELISVITESFVEHLALPVPTFDEFANRATSQGKRVSPYPLSADFELDVDGFIRHVIDVEANAVVLVRPNNPTGTLVPSESLRHMLAELRGLDLVLLDESFVDFVDEDPTPSSDGIMDDFPNLVIMKSLSKIYGIPGLRLGYASSSNREMIAELRRQIPIWSVNSMAQYFLEQMGDYRDQYLESCWKVVRATRVLHEALRRVPFLHAYPTKGNFVMCRIVYGLGATELTARLFEEFGILINNLGNKSGLEDRFVRFACRTTEDNADLIQAIQAISATIPEPAAYSRRG